MSACCTADCAWRELASLRRCSTWLRACRRELSALALLDSWHGRAVLISSAAGPPAASFPGMQPVVWRSPRCCQARPLPPCRLSCSHPCKGWQSGSCMAAGPPVLLHLLLKALHSLCAAGRCLRCAGGGSLRVLQQQKPWCGMLDHSPQLSTLVCRPYLQPLLGGVLLLGQQTQLRLGHASVPCCISNLGVPGSQLCSRLLHVRRLGGSCLLQQPGALWAPACRALVCCSASPRHAFCSSSARCTYQERSRQLPRATRPCRGQQSHTCSAWTSCSCSSWPCCCSCGTAASACSAIASQSCTALHSCSLRRLPPCVTSQGHTLALVAARVAAACSLVRCSFRCFRSSRTCRKMANPEGITPLVCKPSLGLCLQLALVP